MALTLLIILNCVLLGILGGNLLHQYTRNKWLESDNAKLRIQNRELTKLALDANRYKTLRYEFMKVKMKAMYGSYDSERAFCSDIARIIKNHCE